MPEWAGSLEVNGAHSTDVRREDGWLLVPAQLARRMRLEIKFDLTARVVLGDHGNAGGAALMWGPYVLAYDQQQNNLRKAPPMLGIVPENETVPVSLATVAGGPLKFAAKVHSVRHRNMRGRAGAVCRCRSGRRPIPSVAVRTGRRIAGERALSAVRRRVGRVRGMCLVRSRTGKWPRSW